MRKSPLFALLAVSVASSLGASDVVGRADGTLRLPTVALVRTTTGTNAPAVLKVAGHSHTCRKLGVSMQTTYERLHEWAERNEVAAMGLGSPWSVANAAMTRHYETELRDLYFAGKATDCPFNSAEIESVIQAANDYPGNRTLFYVDNETPKSRYGHLWHIGFRVVVPNWHDYNQDRSVWYSALDDATAETNTVAGGPHKRRTYRAVVDEQRAGGALCIWAHPTSWWTTNGDPNGPFVTNIAAEMVPQLLEDGYLDGLTVQGYDAYHRDYQALWFALLDLGYRVPGFSELDISIGHNITGRDTALFNVLPATGIPVPLKQKDLIREFRAARHTMSSGPLLFLSVDNHPQGDELRSGADVRHVVKVVAYPARNESRLSRVELVGRRGEVLAVVRDFAGGTIEWDVRGTDAGGYLVARCFGEMDGDYAFKAQQRIRQCAITNPVWFRTPRFQPPEPVRTVVDHMANPTVRRLMDYLATGAFRKDYPGCVPGVVPVEAFRIPEMREALLSP